MIHRGRGKVPFKRIRRIRRIHKMQIWRIRRIVLAFVFELRLAMMQGKFYPQSAYKEQKWTRHQLRKHDPDDADSVADVI